MGQILSRKQILDQSNCAYNEWKEKWRVHAKFHGKFKQNSMEELRNVGIGRSIVLVANGASLENDLEYIKQNPDAHTMVCDKTLGHLLKAGVKPTYCIMADAVVDYEKYCAPYKDQLEETILLANVCGNTKWASEPTWKNIYFYVNKDIIKSEKEFQQLSGCPNVIAAGSNVSNAMVIIATQCDNSKKQNLMNYDKMLLTGFDYSWLPKGNYYAFDKEAKGKTYFMNHQLCQNVDGDLAYTSNNLAFSAKWLYGYVTSFGLPVIQCSQRSILPLPTNGKLKDHISYKYRCEDSESMVKLEATKRDLMKKINMVMAKQKEIQNDHVCSVIKTI